MGWWQCEYVIREYQTMHCDEEGVIGGWWHECWRESEEVVSACFQGHKKWKQGHCDYSMTRCLVWLLWWHLWCGSSKWKWCFGIVFILFFHEVKDEDCQQLDDQAKDIIKACGKLLLILEEIDQFLKKYNDLEIAEWIGIWEEALQSLREAKSFDGCNDDKLWGS